MNSHPSGDQLSGRRGFIVVALRKDVEKGHSAALRSRPRIRGVSPSSPGYDPVHLRQPVIEAAAIRESHRRFLTPLQIRLPEADPALGAAVVSRVAAKKTRIELTQLSRSTSLGRKDVSLGRSLLRRACQ